MSNGSGWRRGIGTPRLSRDCFSRRVTSVPFPPFRPVLTAVAWDLAATDGAGDYTVGAKLGRGADGVFYIIDIQRGQWESGYRDQIIRQTAELDGRCTIRIPQDPGAAGKSEAQRLATMLAGFEIKKVPVTGNKLTRTIGFASQVNVGNVKILEKYWYTGLRERLNAFPAKGVPDDEVDALADAFNELTAKKRLIISVAQD